MNQHAIEKRILHLIIFAIVLFSVVVIIVINVFFSIKDARQKDCLEKTGGNTACWYID